MTSLDIALLYLLAGARVVVVLGDGSRREVRTGEDGNFSLEGLPAYRPSF